MFYSNPPWINTGYGGDMRNICPRLMPYHKVAIHCNCNLMRIRNWNGIDCFPDEATVSLFGDFWEQSYMSLVSNFKAWRADIAILHYDTGVMANKLIDSEIPYLAYVPIDSDPPSPDLIHSLKGAKRIISICNWQKKLLKEEYDMESVVIPNGVDLKIFYPPANEEAKRECRRMFDIPDDKFVFLAVGANRDIRKGFAEMMQAYSMFIHNNKDAEKNSIFYLQTNMEGAPGAYNLHRLAKLFGIEDNVMFTDQEEIEGISDGDMGNLYRSGDVFVNCAQGEGFGKCIAEAEACGLPAIVTDFTAMPELVEGHGFRVKVAATQCQNLSLGFRAIPDIYGIKGGMTYYFFRPDELKRDGLASSRFIRENYNWDELNALWLKVLEEFNA
jgi:glycosyltransferase involved in cell wall biosynthesis